MLRELLKVLHSGDGPDNYTVPELASRLGAQPDQVRLGLWQLQRLGLLDQWGCPAGAAVAEACGACPTRDCCTHAAGAVYSTRIHLAAPDQLQPEPPR